MNFFVFYNDDYADNGGVGFAEFATAEQAEAFIAKRMKLNDDPPNNIEMKEQYTVVRGRKMDLKIVSVIDVVKLRETNEP